MHPKRQHYVPQFLLRGFAIKGKGRVYAFDKQTGNVFEASLDRIANERAFYDIETPDGTASIEPALATLESTVAPIIARIREKLSLSQLTESDAVTLALFAMVQHQRTVNYRAKVRQLNTEMAEWLRKLGFDPKNVKGFKDFDEDDLRAFSLLSVAKAHEFVPHLLDKAWVLFQASPNTSFYIGDNPIAMQNRKDFGFYGNIGLAVPGIEIYLPISADLTLAWLSESFIQECEEAITLAEAMKQEPTADAERVEHLANVARTFLNTMEERRVVQCEEANVVNLNSLQVKYSERFLYSSEDNFDLARQMIADNSGLRIGPRGKLG